MLYMVLTFNQDGRLIDRDLDRTPREVIRLGIDQRVYERVCKLNDTTVRMYSHIIPQTWR